jgi:hypothetical protein
MSLIDEARAVQERISERLRELEPLVREYQQLTQIAAEMGLPEQPPADAPGASSPSSPSASQGSTGKRRKTTAARRSPRRARASGARRQPASSAPIADRVLDAVRSQPGKTVADYADILKVPATALYRPVRELTNQGALLKRARQLFPA